MKITDHRPVASPELRRRALVRSPGGVHSNVRLDGPQEFISHAEGAWLHGVDGRDYVDYLLGQGPAFLGHAPEPVNSAVQSACRRGVLYGGQHPLEVRAAEEICSALGWPESVRFGMTGTDMVQVALRLARAATGRTKVIRFEGHYHGWHDNVLIAEGNGAWGPASAGQLPSHLHDSIVLPWNDEDRVADVLEYEGDQIAAVIMEPVMINAGAIEPLPGYLERVRRLCSRHGVILIFDEIITGFRLGLAGAVGRYGVIPDLATYGKAMGGGWPAAALTGRDDLMQLIGTGGVVHSGTFNGNVASMAAIEATIAYLRDSPPYDAIAEYGTSLMAGIRRLGTENNLPLRVQGLPAAFHVSLGDADVTDYRSLHQLDLARYAELASVLVDHGIWVARRGIWYVSAAHGLPELDVTLTRFKAALMKWQ